MDGIEDSMYDGIDDGIDDDIDERIDDGIDEQHRWTASMDGMDGRHR